MCVCAFVVISEYREVCRYAHVRVCTCVGVYITIGCVLHDCVSGIIYSQWSIVMVCCALWDGVMSGYCALWDGVMSGYCAYGMV